MRTIYRIARLELSTLFYSPVAWLVLVVFAFQAGLQFTSNIERYEAYQQMGQAIRALTSQVFTLQGQGLFSDMQSKLYLYIPLLTMGLMSRETSSGSIKLLLSSPTRMREIVLGKFLAMMIYGFILIMILLLFVMAGISSIQSMDIKFVFSGLLGLYLLICAYSAIGLFMSSLTSYQVVAAISTLVVLGMLNYVGLLGQKINFLRDITYFLSISGRADQMITGLISSKDVLYFIIVVSLFLGLSILKLQFARESRSAAFKVTRYALLVCFSLLIGYFVSRPVFTKYYDMTANKSMTLTPNSQEVVKSLKEPVTLTVYSNLLDERGSWTLPENKNNVALYFQQYTRFLPRMKVEYVYYYDSCAYSREVLAPRNPGLSLEQLAKRTAASYKVDMDMFLTPAQIRKQIDLRPEGNRLVRQLEIGGKKTFLRMFADFPFYPTEGEITAALRRFTTVSPKVAFLSGHNERTIEKSGDRDFKFPSVEKTFRYALINQGFDVDTLSIKERDVPPDVSLLIIADPRTAMDELEQARLSAYINRGGNLLIAAEPDKKDVLNPVIAPLGVQFSPGNLVYLSQDDPADNVRADVAKETLELFKSNNPLYKEPGGPVQSAVAMPGVMGVASQGNSPFKITPVLITKDSANSWNSLKKIEADSIKKFTPGEGDTRQSFTTAVALKRMAGNKEQRIMIFGDADFMDNLELTKLARSGYSRLNFQFYREIIRWLSNDQFPLDVSRPVSKDNVLKITSAGVSGLKILFLGSIPGLLILFSSVLLIIRKRK